MGWRSHRELVVWQRAMALVERVYAVTRGFPAEEVYGLTSQLRRASVSVPSNIAEGHGRGGRDFPRYLDIAQGSLAELDTQLELARRLGYLDEGEAAALLGEAGEISKMALRLRGVLRRALPAGRTAVARKTKTRPRAES